jgi:hypothetical protein
METRPAGSLILVPESGFLDLEPLAGTAATFEAQLNVETAQKNHKASKYLYVEFPVKRSGVCG